MGETGQRVLPGINIPLISRWIEACNQEHGDSCIPLPRIPSAEECLPKRVIDTQRQCLVPGEAADRYVALSYRWTPMKAQPLMLQKATLASFRTPGFFGQPHVCMRLPTVINDAMALTKRLGIRYLWVDRLCITQHDEEAQHEIQRMDQIYSRAWLTIIAAASGGIQGAGDVLQDTRCRAVTQGFGTAQTTDGNSTDNERFKVPSDPVLAVEEHYSHLLNSEWASRGWTFQEHIFCRRAVIFLDRGEMFWDCQISLWDEEHWGKAVPGPFANACFRRGRQLLAKPGPGSFSAYVQMACLYSCRGGFTDEADVLHAFAGTLNALKPSFPGCFVSGLPVSFLDHALLWQPYKKAQRREVAQLPSWSWCGWKCPIDPHSLRTGLACYDGEVHGEHASTWRTRSLVQWTGLTADKTGEMRIPKPGDSNNATGDLEDLPQEGTGTVSGTLESRHRLAPTFRNEKDPECERLPLTFATATAPWECAVPFLRCQAPRATLHIDAILEPRRWRTLQAALKVSVFELQHINRVAYPEDLNAVLVLADSRGRFAGLLRAMDDAAPPLGARLTTVAVSTGSCRHDDTKDCYEEQVYRRGVFGRGPDRATFSPRSHRFRAIEIEERWRRKVSGEAFVDSYTCYAGKRPYDVPPGFVSRSLSEEYGEGETYEFYNVLWVEWRGGVAYRRACGRVPKHIWELNASSPEDIILG
ncbi:heterokaryon incompatibility protein-domain-containing protein [Xylariomycetidae sp. FL0641]|nr:heterokaryon incompatibility protein-domain-containing protein [Xylariomycetidae sp. FL0641]